MYTLYMYMYIVHVVTDNITCATDNGACYNKYFNIKYFKYMYLYTTQKN